MSISDAVKAITDEIGSIFRHIVPGVIVPGFAYKSHPGWFSKLCFNNTTHIIILAVAALAVGNFWYVFHRYSLHNLLDWFCWLLRTGKWKTLSWGGYRPWLFQHIEDSFTLPDSKKRLQQFIHLRSSQIILLFITSQAMVLFSFWHESNSYFDEYPWRLGIVGIGIFLVAMVQYFISNGLDITVVGNNKQQ